MASGLLKNKVKAWTLYSSVVNNNTASIPSDYTELLIVISVNNELYTRIFTKDMLNANNQYIREGYYYSTSACASIIARITNTLASLQTIFINGASKLDNNASLKVYYR